jgi:hypothetical protein
VSIGIGGDGTGAGDSAWRAGASAVVAKTGLALVHEGESIYAAPGAEAEVAPTPLDPGLAITVHLPVLIEMVGTTSDLDATVDETLRRLRAAVESLRERD